MTSSAALGGSASAAVSTDIARIPEQYRDCEDRMAATISHLAARARKLLRRKTAARREADLRRLKPMDYLRRVEFPLTYMQLSLRPGTRVLDVASPQWFSLFAASQHPETSFVYVNILESELAPAREIAERLGLWNIEYRLADARKLPFEKASFDAAVSISTIEHIAPESGGDAQALAEIHRVLKPGSDFVISIPMNETRSVSRDDKHAVWERSASSGNFYMRHYDPAQFRDLAAATAFDVRASVWMYEKRGIFALDYWEGGPGKRRLTKNCVLWIKKRADKWMRHRLESRLAKRYIGVSHSEVPPRETRLINLVSRLSKEAPAASSTRG